MYTTVRSSSSNTKMLELHEMTLKELLPIAKKHKIRGRSKMRKRELVRAIAKKEGKEYRSPKRRGAKGKRTPKERPGRMCERKVGPNGKQYIAMRDSKGRLRWYLATAKRITDCKYQQSGVFGRLGMILRGDTGIL